MGDTKKVLLVHKPISNDGYEDFHKALQRQGGGSIDAQDVDSNKYWRHVNTSWLDKTGNFALLCFSPDSIDWIQNIVEEKGLMENGILHDKIFTLSLGKSCHWPHETRNERDFSFDFESIENISDNQEGRIKYFQEHANMMRLVAALQGVQTA